MNENLIVRLYRVGFGDCIFVQIPDNEAVFTILIDCGTSSPAEPVLKEAVRHIIAQLPRDEQGSPHLDLLVATHPHADHIKGFDPKWFEDVSIGRIWMTTFMNLDHPLAKGAQAFEQAAFEAASFVLALPGLHFSDGAQALLERSLSLSNTAVFQALREGGIPTKYPRLYAARDVAEHLSVEELSTHCLSYSNNISTYKGFKDPQTQLHILAPEWDIDATYLGQFSPQESSFTDTLVQQTDAYRTEGGTTAGAEDPAEVSKKAPQPANISPRDFRLLRSRLLYSALAFSQEDDDLKNNVSIVLLLTWRGRRLLFTGDAEHGGVGVEAGRRNNSWNVMLNNPDVRDILRQPLDLFKVAHHGSHNGTPLDGDAVGADLEEMLSAERTHVVVSTMTGVHGKKNPVPYIPLMQHLGQLAYNQTRYMTGEEDLVNIPQPRRTDRESDSTDPGVDFIEVILTPIEP